MASPLPCPESERGEKGSKRDGEKNEEEKEIGGRKKKGTEKRAAREKGEGGRARASPPGVQAIQKRSLAAGYKNVLIIRC